MLSALDNLCTTTKQQMVIMRPCVLTISVKRHALKTSKRAEYSSRETSLKKQRNVHSLTFFLTLWDSLWDYMKDCIVIIIQHFITFCRVINVKHISMTALEEFLDWSAPHNSTPATRETRPASLFNLWYPKNQSLCKHSPSVNIQTAAHSSGKH